MKQKQSEDSELHQALDDQASENLPSERTDELTLWQTTQSVLYAMLGVQKSKNAKRDFSKGKASHFIVLGIAFGIFFVLSVALVVKLVLHSATN